MFAKRSRSQESMVEGLRQRSVSVRGELDDGLDEGLNQAVLSARRDPDEQPTALTGPVEGVSGG